MDTAAALKNLDLVITVDTSVAHLAGALGAPVWVALQCPGSAGLGSAAIFGRVALASGSGGQSVVPHDEAFSADAAGRVGPTSSGGWRRS